MFDIKIDDNGLFEEIRRLNVDLNSNKLEQLVNQHSEIDKKWVEILNHFKNNHFPYDNLVILVEFNLRCAETNAEIERVFSVGNDFWTSEKSRLNVDTLAVAFSVKFNIKDIFCSEISDVLENDTLTKKLFNGKDTPLSK
ncbi:dimer_Tnp_hAT domain-containing protein [Trichonephila clavipes]|nr:dimer_Tnp_hAT domain-containing protein [Trichonephila clavipes]